MFVAPLTVPDNQDTPADGFECGLVRGIPMAVTLYFREPIAFIALGLPYAFLAAVCMPKTSMNKYGELAAYPCNIRLARQVFPVKTITRVT